MLARLGLRRNPMFSYGVCEGVTPGLADFLVHLQVFLHRIGHRLGGLGIIDHATHLALPEIEISLCKIFQIWGISHWRILSFAYFSQNACCTRIKFLLRNNKLW